MTRLGSWLYLLVLAALCVLQPGLAACSSTQPSPTCSDAAYQNQLLTCGVAAAKCVQKGGTDAECGSVCDKEWADWQERCSQ